MARKAKLQRSTRYVGLSRGVKKRWMASGPVSLGGTRYTPQEILDTLEEMLDAQQRTSHAYGAWRAQLAEQRALEKAGRAFTAYLESAIRLLYGQTRTILVDFGLEPTKKTGPKTAAVKVAAADKARATRKRRGTMGPRQKKKVKGGT